MARGVMVKNENYKIQKTKDDKSGESDTVRTSSVDIQSQQI